MKYFIPRLTNKSLIIQINTLFPIKQCYSYESIAYIQANITKQIKYYNVMNRYMY